MTGKGCRRIAAAVLATVSLMALTGCDENALLPSATGGASASGAAQLPNPIVEYGSYEELCQAVGFNMVQLQYLGLEPVTYASIDGTLAEIIYGADAGDATVTLREQQGVDTDISGVYGVQYETYDLDATQVRIGKLADPDHAGTIQAAWFSYGGNSYSVSATGMSDFEFPALAQSLVDSVTMGQTA